MQKEFCLPDLGEGLTSAKITDWHITEGKKVIADQLLCSVETTKAIVDIPAPYSGTLQKIAAKAGTNVATGSVLCVIEALAKKTPLMASARKTNMTDAQTAMFNKISSANQQVALTTLTEMAKITTKVSTANLVFALSKTLEQHKIFNASYRASLQYHETIDIGIAVQAEELLIATINDCQNLNLSEIQQLVDAIKHKPNKKSSRMILSNIGSTGVGLFATPSVMPPGLATLAVGRKIIQPEWHNNSWQAANFLPLSLSFDHRLITGSAAAEFLKTFITNLS